MTEYRSNSVIRWATLRDMKGDQFKKIYRELEDYQFRFFSVQDKVKGEPYKWPLKPLYEWSRRVEYPFVVSMLPNKKGIRLFDAGSGVTFFSLYLVQVLGMNVECFDIEQSYVVRSRQVCDLLSQSPPLLFHVGNLTKRLPFDSGIFDVVLCISVLEHLPAKSRLTAIHELWRLVSPGGCLIMTFDVSLTSEKDELLFSEVEKLISKLSELVGPLPLPPIPPPQDILTPQHPGYGLAPIQVRGSIVRFGIRSWLMRLLNKPLPIFQPLACLLCFIPKHGSHDL